MEASSQPAHSGTQSISVAAMLRAGAVTFGGSLVLLIGAAASLIATTLALSAGSTPALLPLAGTAATAVYLVVLVPWMNRWGSTRAERAAHYPGEDAVVEPGIVTTHAVTIDTPAQNVWPWLAQIGQDRGGFYSHAWLENLAGCGLRNADRIHPEWQRRSVGEMILLHPDHGLELTLFEPGRALMMGGWGPFVLVPHGERTRLIVRGRVPRRLPAVLFDVLLMKIPHFIMERSMLLGIKERAEGR